MKRRNINLKEMAHTLGRVLRYMLKNYKGSFCVVVVCTLVSALCTLSGTLFLQSLIDDYILPLTQSAAPDFGPLGWALARMACVYALGILSSYGYNRIMVNISQGTAAWTPPTRSASPRPSWPTPTASSAACPTGTTPSSPGTAPT